MRKKKALDKPSGVITEIDGARVCLSVNGEEGFSTLRIEKGGQEISIIIDALERPHSQTAMVVWLDALIAEEQPWSERRKLVLK